MKIEWPKEPGPLVIVKWVDPTDLGSGWESAEKAAQQKPEACLTVGWILHEDERNVVVVASVAGDDVGNGMTIPVATIEVVEVVTFDKAGG